MGAGAAPLSVRHGAARSPFLKQCCQEPAANSYAAPERHAKEKARLETRKPLHTGGCQCGAVRYALYAEPTDPHVCHCRMCQKAFGNYFAAFAGVPPADFAWVKGIPGVFKSSQAAERGFCRDCGTPLSFRYAERDRISISLGSLDGPSRVPPARQYGVESRLPFVAALTSLLGTRTQDEIALPARERLKSRQHPDRAD